MAQATFAPRPLDREAAPSSCQDSVSVLFALLLLGDKEWYDALACKVRELQGALEGRAGSHDATSSSKGVPSFLAAAQPSIGRKVLRRFTRTVPFKHLIDERHRVQ